MVTGFNAGLFPCAYLLMHLFVGLCKKPLLHSNDDELRISAASTLAKIGDSTTIPALIAALSDENRIVCIYATNALQEIGKLAVPHLIQALNDEDDALRAEVIHILGQIGDSAAVPHLVKVLSDTDGLCRQYAVSALGWIGDPTAIPALINALTGRAGGAGTMAAAALADIGEHAIPALTKALNHEDMNVRGNAVFQVSRRLL